MDIIGLCSTPHGLYDGISCNDLCRVNSNNAKYARFVQYDSQCDCRQTLQMFLCHARPVPKLFVDPPRPQWPLSRLSLPYPPAIWALCIG